MAELFLWISFPNNNRRTTVFITIAQCTTSSLVDNHIQTGIIIIILTIIVNTAQQKKTPNTVITMTGASASAGREQEGRVLIMEENHITEGDLLLCDADFPANYVHMAHPDDYKQVDIPLPINRLLHQKIGHWRLILRVSFRLANGKYLPMSFVCDTGAPYDFYLSREAMKNLTSCGRVKEDEIGNAYLDDVVGRKAAVRETPYTHEPANILGLRMMLKLGCKLTETGFEFTEAFESL